MANCKWLLVVFLLFSAPAFADNDKLLHATGSYVLTNIFLEVGMTKKQAFVTTLLIGAVKELGDNNTPEEHRKDMAANLLGASGALFVFRWKL